MAKGHAAVYAEKKSEEKKTIRIKLGNLLPLKEATLCLQLVYIVPVDCSSYKFTLPIDFYPNYKKMGAPNK